MKIKTVLVSIWVLIILPTMAYALFVDSVSTQGNIFSAATLQTQLTPEKVPVIMDITYNTPFASTLFVLTNLGQLNTTNSLSSSIDTNIALAQKITVSVTLDDTIPIYTGLLTNLNQIDYLLQNVAQVNKLGFIFSMTQADYDSTRGESTTFRIVNNARQQGVAYGSGFYDNKSMEITLNNPTVVIP
jgi:hypothetical protein